LVLNNHLALHLFIEGHVLRVDLAISVVLVAKDNVLFGCVWPYEQGQKTISVGVDVGVSTREAEYTGPVLLRSVDNQFVRD